MTRLISALLLAAFATAAWAEDSCLTCAQTKANNSYLHLANAGGKEITLLVDPEARASEFINKKAFTKAIQTWASNCDGRHLPVLSIDWERDVKETERNLLHSDSKYVIIVDYKPDEEVPIETEINEKGEAINTAHPGNLRGNVMTLYGRCPDGNFNFSCKKGNLDWTSAGGIASISHELGHAMGLDHDKENCKTNGTMASAFSWASPPTFLATEYCELAERITSFEPCNELGDDTNNACDDCHYTVTGAVSGLSRGEILRLLFTASSPNISRAETIIVSGNGSFETQNEFTAGSSYQLVVEFVSNPQKVCSIAPANAGVLTKDGVAFTISCECTGEETDCDSPVLDEPRENLPPDEITDICLILPHYCDPPVTDPWFWNSGPPGKDCDQKAICVSSREPCEGVETQDGMAVFCEVLTCRPGCAGASTFTLRGPRIRLDQRPGEPPWKATVPLTGSVNDEDGVALLRFYVDGHRIEPPMLAGVHRPDACSGVRGDCDPYSGFLAEFDTTTLSDGAHTLQIVAIDATEWPVAGYHEIAFEVDNACVSTQVPQVWLTAPASVTSVSGVVAVAAEAIAAAGVERVRLVIDGVRSATDWSAPFSWSWDSASVGDGPHRLQAEVYDRCGGVVRSPEVLVEVVNHNDPPRLQVEWPQPGASVQGVVEVSGWALDADGVPRIEVRLGDEPLVLSRSVQRVVRTEICSAFPVADPACPEVGWSAVFDSAQRLDGGYLLTVVATDARGASITSSRPLTVANRLGGPPGVSAPSSQTVMLGDPASFAVEAWGGGPFSFQWQVRRDNRWVNLADGAFGGRLSGARSAVLRIEGIDWSDAGGYRCVVSNLGGSRASVSASLSVIERVDPPNVVVGLDQVIPAGSAAELRVTAEGEGPLTFRWQHETAAGWQNLADGGRLSGAATAVLRIDATQLGDAGRYRCRITNIAGTTTSDAMSLAVTEPVGTCAGGATTLCLQQNRFSVRVNVAGADARVISWSDLVGFFRLANPSNVEVMVKALDGREANGHFWIFHGSLTSQPYTVTVTDTVQNVTKTYFKGSGSFCGEADTAAFYDAVTGAMQAGLLVPLAPVAAASGTGGTCFSTDTSVCLLDNRFQVEVRRYGLPVRALGITDLAGTFSFGRWENSDVVVKVLDGTPVNDWYWVFFGSMTSQSYEVRVTDTASGEVRTYPAPGSACGQADTTAF